jgi:hypothetical protein
MNEFERRIRQLINRLTQWWGDSAGATKRRRIEGAATLRQEATARAHQAAAKARDLRETDAAKKAAAKLSDLRSTETAKKAENAIADLRQREPVKKAEEGARKVLHDLFSGGKSGDHS